MTGPITKFEINRMRLLLIKQEIFHQYETYNEFREELFPQIKLNTFRQWFKKPFYISDHRLCMMEDALEIPSSFIKDRLKGELQLSIKALRTTKGIQFTATDTQFS